MISEEQGKKEVSYHQQRLETDDGDDGCMSCASPPLPSSKPPGKLRGPPGESPGMADGQRSQNHSSQPPPAPPPLSTSLIFLLTHTLHPPPSPCDGAAGWPGEPARPPAHPFPSPAA